jgi:hypothetical protein
MFGDSQNNVKYSTVMTEGSPQLKELETVVAKNL